MNRFLRIDFSVVAVSLVALMRRKVGLPARHPYSVMLKGTPLWWIGPDGMIQEIGGFYTERLEMASSPDEATSLALARVKREVQQFAKNPAESPVCIVVTDVYRVSGFIRWHGRGFTFWSKTEDQTSGLPRIH